MLADLHQQLGTCIRDNGLEKDAAGAFRAVIARIRLREDAIVINPNAHNRPSLSKLVGRRDHGTNPTSALSRRLGSSVRLSASATHAIPAALQRY